MASEGDECYLPTHMLEVSIVEDNNGNSTELQDVFLEPEEDVDVVSNSEPILISTPAANRIKRTGIPVVTTTPEELEFYNRLFEDLSIMRYFRIHCSVCDCHIGCSPESADIAFRHRVLGVLVCKQCYVFYGEGNFPQGDDESEVYCRWCGQGGRLVCCSTCPCTFCKKCISRNFTKRAKLNFENRIDWECFICQPRFIWEHRAFCWAVTQYIQKESEDWKCGIESGREMYGPKAPAPGDDASVCCEGSSSHRRISAGLPEEERLKSLVQSANRQKILDMNGEKSLVTQLNGEKWNKMPRIKARDISELTGVKQAADSFVPSPVLNPVSVLNPNNSSNLNYHCPPLTPMVQIPAVTPPSQNKQSDIIAPQASPMINPCNPIISPSISGNSSVGDFPPYGRFILKPVGSTGNNMVRLPVVTGSQLSGFFPNPMAVIRCTTSQTTPLNSQLFTTLTQGSQVANSGMNSKGFTKIAIVNGQMTVPNQPGCYYVNAGEKKLVGPVIQQVRQLPNPNAVPQNFANVPSTNDVMVNAETDDGDDDIRIISTTSPEIEGNSNSQKFYMLLPKSAASTLRPKPATANTLRPKPATANTLRPNPAAANTLRPNPAAATTLRPYPTSTTSLQSNPASTTSLQPNPASTTSLQPNPAFTTSLQSNPVSSTALPRVINTSPVKIMDENFPLCKIVNVQSVRSTEDFITVSDNDSANIQPNTTSGNESMCVQFEKCLLEADNISRNMNSHILLMRKVYKKALKQNAGPDIGTLVKKFRRLLKKSIQKFCAIDSSVLNDLDANIMSRNSEKIRKNTSDDHSVSNQNINIFESPGQKSDDTLSGVDESESVQMVWDSNDSSDSDTLPRQVEDTHKSQLKTSKHSRNQNNSSFKSSPVQHNVNAGKKYDFESSNKSKKFSYNIGIRRTTDQVENERDSVTQNPLRCTLSETELKKSMRCSVPVKREVIDLEPDSPVKKRKRSDSAEFPNPKRRNSYISTELFREMDSSQLSSNLHVPSKWAKLIRPCSVVLVKAKMNMDT